jgi:hypothetical protein
LLPSIGRAESEDEKALKSLTLTCARMEQYVSVMEKAAAWEAANPALAKKYERDDSSDQSLSGIVRSIERSPEFTSIVKSQRLSVREYVLTTCRNAKAGSSNECIEGDQKIPEEVMPPTL